MPPYHSGFFNRKLVEGSARSARAILPTLIARTRPKSILDLGCGMGTWLSVAKELGIPELHGFDGSYVRREYLKISEEEFHPIDLLKEMPQPVRVDLAICLEVAEHLPESRAAAVVEFLTSCSDIIYFSAAIPGQGGTHHVNEQWQSYWATRFHGRGYEVSTDLRDRFWREEAIEVWYRQNALLYAKRGRFSSIDVELRPPGTLVLDLVHPDLLGRKLAPYALFEKLFQVRDNLSNAFRAVAPAWFPGRKDL